MSATTWIAGRAAVVLAACALRFLRLLRFVSRPTDGPTTPRRA